MFREKWVQKNIFLNPNLIHVNIKMSKTNSIKTAINEHKEVNGRFDYHIRATHRHIQKIEIENDHQLDEFSLFCRQLKRSRKMEFQKKIMIENASPT